MHWFLIHTKPRQEKCALQNLVQQGYQCYLPTISSEKLRHGVVTVSDEPLFPRYLFIRLGLGESAKSWAPIRSTKGVSRLVIFGVEPAKVDDKVIRHLQEQESDARKPSGMHGALQSTSARGNVLVGVDGIYQIDDGERRVMALIELLSRPIPDDVVPTCLRRII